MVLSIALLLGVLALLLWENYRGRRERAEMMRRIQDLTRRVWRLENGGGEAEPAQAPAGPAAFPAAVPPADDPAPAGVDWEGLVGADWLNKLGVLVLVVGVSLFLRYSLAYLGPAGKITVGMLVSAALLAGGVLLERRDRYVVFGRGLLGGGWAALYFTTYAMHGVPASRIIDSPTLGFSLLLALSAGMIAHSLHYRSQAVTGVAYFVAFVTLAISPVSGFSVAASVPLAATLLLIAHRFGWTPMAVAGVVLTYTVFAVQGERGSWPAGGFLGGSPVLWLYWLMFEAYDLLRLRRRGEGAAGRLLLPLNLLGLVWVTLFLWQPAPGHRTDVFYSAAAAGCLASALLRGLAGAGYQLAAGAAACLAAAAIFEHFRGIWVSFWLFVEAELLILASNRLRRGRLRLFAALFCAAVLGWFLTSDVPGGVKTAVAGTLLHNWTPLAVLMAAVFLADGRVAASGYGYAGSLLLAIVIGREARTDYVTVAWGGLALALMCAGFLSRDRVLRISGLALCAVCLAKLFFWDLRELDAVSRILSFLALGVVLILISWVYARFRDDIRRYL